MLSLLHLKCNSSTLCCASATSFVPTDTDLTSCEKLQIALDWPGFLMHVPDLSHSMGVTSLLTALQVAQKASEKF